MNEQTQRRVVCAAIRNKRGHIICGARHFDSVMRQQIANSADARIAWVTAEEGFIDQRGRWMSREEARVVADAACQILRRCGGDEERLYSENLY